MSLKHFCLPLLTVISLAAASQAVASGFAIFTQSATGLAKANSAVAHHDEPSALFFNPALMGKLSGTQVEAGTTLLFPDRSFNSSVTSASTDADKEVYFPSTFYLTHSLSDTVSTGLAVYNPFGLGTDWGTTWEGRYIATKSELTTFNFNPSLSWKPVPMFTVAAGVDLIMLDTTLERNINSAALGTMMGIPGAGLLADSNQKFEGDGNGWGYNLGILVDLSDAVSLGVSYRSQVDVDISGTLNFHVPHPALGFMLPNTDAETEITLPDQLQLGLAWQASELLAFEVGARWEGWSCYDRLELTTSQPVLGSNTISETKDWSDTWAYNIGVDYQLNPQWQFAAGYLYGDTPVPDATFEPAVPGSPSHLFTLGAKWQDNEHLGISFSYGYQHLEDRTKNNLVMDPLSQAPVTSANGEYSTDIHLLALSFIYKF